MSFFDDIAALASSGSAMDQFGRGMSIGGTLLAGWEASKAASYRADQYRQNASDAEAVGQRRAYNEGEKTKLVMSEALARAAASGGGASDPTIVNIMAKIASEGAYHKAVALYSGEQQAQEMNQRADLEEYSGKSSKFNSVISAGAQLFGARASLMKDQANQDSMYRRFGMGSPADGSQ
jgi:hypothetical protein